MQPESPWPGKDVLDSAIREAVLDEAARLGESNINPEEIRARLDAYVYGTGYIVNGKRVDPSLVHIYRRQPVSLTEAEMKKAVEDFKRPYVREPLFFTNIRRALTTLRRVFA